jgi:hypothetical protein
MHVVRHERVRVHVAPAAFCKVAQVAEKEPVVRVGVEARLAIVATLDDMDGQSGYPWPFASCHAGFNEHPA